MENKKKVRILTLDGGGIRGIIPATVLQYVEEYLQQKKPNTTLADHFDFIAGTSTGGILSAIYLAPDDKDPSKAKFSANEALDFYVKEGANIFNKAKLNNWQRLWGLRNATQFSPKNIERLLKDKFGDLVMSKLRKPCLITTYNMNSKSSYFFTSTEDESKREFYVRDVLRSTSAAPTYFPPAKIKNIAPESNKEPKNAEMINLDGGVFANNPTMCAYAEARNTEFKERNNLKPTASHMYILSIGTGGGGFTIENKENSTHWSLLKWAKTIPEIMMDGSIDTVAFQMNEIHATLPPNVPGDYLRVDTPKEDRQYSSDMSNADEENIKMLLKAGEKTLEKAKIDGLDQFLDGLLDN
ncbi:MAG: patatin [Flavobacteriales bacterium]|nr:patatin [Flavobacteriales bacterium]|tara:strand:+ start:31486 stop:32550 length:1065 start_codon:yes stop_codon:yes gene_type:complete